MAESIVSERIPHHWYARLYVDTLGFEKQWHEADGSGTVCQVDRGGARSSSVKRRRAGTRVVCS